MLYLLALALGLGVLAKGPVGAILPTAAIAVWLFAEHRLAEVRAMLRPGPAIFALAIGSSWYLACVIGQRYGFLNRQLSSENLGRFVGSLGAMPPWYYVGPILLNSVPLSLLGPLAVVAALRAGATQPVATGSDAEAREIRGRLSVRLLAIFWIVTVVFFSFAAYKRRAYLLPLWPASAVMLAWWIETLRPNRFGRFVRPAVGAICAVLAVGYLFYLPAREVDHCAADSYRPAAVEITRVVGPQEPLFVYGIEDELVPLLFYLDRNAIPLRGKLGDAPPGYVIVPAEVWNRRRGEALELEPVLTARSGRRTLVLLRRGKLYARALSAPGDHPGEQRLPPESRVTNRAVASETRVL